MVQGEGKDLHVEVQAGKHRIHSGISVADGGRDEAPSPHAMLEAALASCTILTLELYAKRKEWQLGTISCDVQIVEESKDKTKITRSIRFSEALTAEMGERLEVIANKCPVHRILSGAVEIATELKR